MSEVAIKTELVDRADRVVVPMDHSKIGLADFITICPLAAVQTVVTDRADEQLGGWLDVANIELITSGHAASGTENAAGLAG